MPPRLVHGSPEDWLRRAQASLALARVHGEGLLREDLCYQAQQAAEKALKALYIARGQAFLFTHDLDRLAMGLEGIGIEIPESIDQATILTRYAMDTRYPGGFEPVGAAEHQEAVRLAETVVAWAWAQIAPPGG
jgi:HEPN domain-containing protein